MRRFLPLLLLAGLAAAAGCAPNPIIVRDPEPAPRGLEQIRCGHFRGLLNDVYSNCVPAAPPPAEAVVRAKG